jgi:transcriptional regulator NrdR family protein
MSRIAALDCAACGSSRITAIATNGHEADRVTRKRKCSSCGHIWYTVELPVSSAVVGWARVDAKGQSKPMLRVPVELAVGSNAV